MFLNIVFYLVTTSLVGVGTPSKPNSRLGIEGETCLSNKDCSKNLTCDNKQCVPMQAANLACDRTSDCDAPMRCVDNICQIPRTNNDEQQEESPRHNRREQPSQVTEPSYFRQRELPPGAHIEARTRRGLWITGTVILGTSYLTTGLVTSIICSGGACPGAISGLAWLPVLGPFVNILYSSSSLSIGLNVFAGLAQGTGLALLIAGLASREEFIVYDSPKMSARIVPMANPNFAGLGLHISHF